MSEGIPEALQGNPEEPENAKSARPTADNIDPRNKGRKHNAERCHLPFCKDCWAIFKGNIMGIKEVADSLLERNEHSATDSEATTDTASLPSSSDTLDTILTSFYNQALATKALPKVSKLRREAKQQIKEWAYHETLNLTDSATIRRESHYNPHTEQMEFIDVVDKAELRAKAAAKWGKQ